MIAEKFSWRSWITLVARSQHQHESTVLIYGAGSAGELLVRHLKDDLKSAYKIVGFIDDDKNLRGRLIHGFRVLGSRGNLAKICEKYSVQKVIVAMPSVKGSVLSDIFNRCSQLDVSVLVMPDLTASLQPNRSLRPINISDLIKRKPKEISKLEISKTYQDKVVMVTGAGGSIGSEICRQIYDYRPKKIILYDQSEFNLYRICEELDEKEPKGVETIPVLGSVVDERSLSLTIGNYRPEIILHAAAYKHVNIVETNPIVGIVNNVVGTLNLVKAAEKFSIKKFVLVSSDKAVLPTNVMGATKRVCELIVRIYQQRSERRVNYCAVRFGNVLGSSGSVVPKFLDQIRQGGPITVTDKEVTRFFMLTSEAVNLVLQASSLSNGGETFILNMGEPVKIYDMAEQLIRLSGLEPGVDIKIAITGLKPGEKLYEELILDGVETASVHEDLFIAKNQELDWDTIDRTISELILLSQNHEHEQAINMLWSLIHKDKVISEQGIL